MSINGNPVPLVVNQQTQVLPPTNGATVLAGVVLNNISPYLLQVQAGVVQTWVAPYTAWPVPTTQLAPISVTPQLLGTAPAGSPAYVVPTWFTQGEQVPDPTTLVAAALSAAIAGNVSLTPGTQVGLTAGSTVGLSAGTQVALVNGTTVQLANGTTVALPAGTAVGLTAGTQVGLSAGSNAVGTVGVNAGQSGTSVSMDSPPQSLGTITVPAASTTATQSFTLPANGTGVEVILNAGGFAGSVKPEVIITGRSGQQYADVVNPSTNNATNGLDVVVGIPGQSENNVTVTVNYVNPSGTTPLIVASVYALVGTGVQQVYTPQNQPLNTAPTIPGAPVTAGFDMALGGGATGSLVASAAGKTVRIYGITWHLSSGAVVAGGNALNVQLQDTAGANLDTIRADIINAGDVAYSPVHSWGGGVPVTTGRGLQFKNVGTLVLDCVGTITYTQS